MTSRGKPQWWEYAESLARRVGGAPDTLHVIPHGDPRMLVVGILGYAAEDSRLDDYERAACQNWLDRLVWPNGEPKEDAA